MNNKGHGPIDYISKGFCITLGIILIKLSSGGVQIPGMIALITGILLILLSVLAFFH